MFLFLLFFLFTNYKGNLIVVFKKRNKTTKKHNNFAKYIFSRAYAMHMHNAMYNNNPKQTGNLYDWFIFLLTHIFYFITFLFSYALNFLMHWMRTDEKVESEIVRKKTCIHFFPLFYSTMIFQSSSYYVSLLALSTTIVWNAFLSFSRFLYLLFSIRNCFY